MTAPHRHIKEYRNSDDTAKRPVDISDLDFGESNHILHEMVDAVLAIHPIPEPEPESLPCLSAEELQALANTFKEKCGTCKSVPKSAPDDPYPNVPAELKALRQWVVWLPHVKPGDDKPSKLLYQTQGWAASTNAERTWTTYSRALACYQKHATRRPFEYRYRPNDKTPYEIFTCYLRGIGFVFSKDDPFCGIDLDDCLDENRKIKPWAQPIVDRLKPVSYREISPGGYGLKYWTRAKLNLPTGGKHKVYIVDGPDAIEAYDSVRYFTVTGRNGKGQIGDGQAVIDWLVSEYMTPDPKPQQTTPVTAARRDASEPTQRTHPQSHLKSADEVMARIRQSRQSHKFDALMQGNMTGYGSPSEADIALCSVIAFWSQDHAIIDAIFRQSALSRDKWDEKHRGDGATYGEMTIEMALSQPRETYTPPKPKTPRRRRAGFYQRRSNRRRYR